MLLSSYGGSSQVGLQHSPPLPPAPHQLPKHQIISPAEEKSYQMNSLTLRYGGIVAHRFHDDSGKLRGEKANQKTGKQSILREMKNTGG